jgi:tetratricopeptide (TPR) repeat protein
MSYLNDPSSNSELRLEAVRGYYELEMYDDAWDELKEVERSFPLTPSILQIKILLLLKEKKWDAAYALSEELQRMEPQNGVGFIQGAYCLHEMNRTDEALALLEEAPESVRKDAIYFYNKGCYEAVMGNVDTAFDCLRKSFDLDQSLLDVARKDPDLIALKDSF